MTLNKPILASVESTPVFILDASRGGLRVAHHGSLPDTGAICRVSLPSEGGAIRLDCAVVHTTIQHANAAAERLFNTGLRIVSADPAAAELLESLVGTEKKP